VVSVRPGKGTCDHLFSTGRGLWPHSNVRSAPEWLLRNQAIMEFVMKQALGGRRWGRLGGALGLDHWG
jgi:hypothetical protein